MTKKEMIAEILRLFDQMSPEDQKEFFEQVAEMMAEHIKKNGDEV